jgi:hypothetical protein
MVLLMLSGKVGGDYTGRRDGRGARLLMLHFLTVMPREIGASSNHRPVDGTHAVPHPQPGGYWNARSSPAMTVLWV